MIDFTVICYDFQSMDIRTPYRVMASRATGSTLQVLNRTTAPMTGREIARLAGVSQFAVQAALSDFVKHGLVSVVAAGRANLYQLNRDHVAMPVVSAAFGMRTLLITRIEELVERWKTPPVHLSIFGSMARGDGSVESDVDILVVRPATTRNDDESWRHHVAELEDAILRWSGNRAALVEVTSRDIREMVSRRRPLIEEIKRDSILILGEPLDVLLSNGGKHPS